MLQRIALLAIAAPRRIVAIAAARHGGLRHLRNPGRQEPVRRRLSGSDVGVGAGDQAAGRQVRPGRHGAVDQRHVRRRRAGRRSPGGRHRHRRAAAGVAVRGRGDLGVDRAAVRRARADQQGRQDRADRRRHHRRRERRAEARQGADRPARARPRRRHRARRRRGDDLRPDQRAERKRPADDGIDRDPAELRGAGVGVRRPAGRGAAVGRRRVRDPGLDGGAAGHHLRHRRVDLRAEPDRRDGPCAGHRLHAADHQPIPRRTGRRRRPRPCAGAHHGDGGPHRAVLGADGRAVDGRDGAVPDVLPASRSPTPASPWWRSRPSPRSWWRLRRSCCSATGWTRSTCAGWLAAFSAGRNRCASPVEQTFWYRSTKFVMRRAIPIGLAIIALLLVLGAPFLGVKWGFPDDRVLPQSLSARQVGDELRNNFAVDSARNVTVVIPDTTGITPAELDRYAATLSQVPDVSSVSAPRRHLRRRQASRSAVGGHRIQGRQRVPHGGQHGAAVLRRLRSPTRPVACGEPSGGATGAADRCRADQPRQLRSDHLSAADWSSA